MIGDRNCPKCHGSGLARTHDGDRYRITVCDLPPKEDAKPKPAISSPHL